MSKYAGNIVTTGADAGYSVAFDGTGDYLTVANQTALDLSTGDFTVECWFYATSAAANNPLIYRFNGNATSRSNLQFAINMNSTGSLVMAPYQGTTVLDITFTGVSFNQWHHCALVRTGNTVYGYLDGVRNATSQSVSTLNGGTWSTYVGYYQEGGVSQYCNGYISNVRIVKGTALYTGATYTPPTQLFNIAGTSLLTCNSPAIIDQSSNAFAITVNGNAKVSTFTPFAGYKTYNPAAGAATPGVWTLSEAMQAAQSRQWNMYDPYFNRTVLALRSGSVDGAQNNTFLDSSSNNFTITRNGNTTQGTFSPFTQTGWSNYFDGASYIEVAGSGTSFTFGTGDFTIEEFFYPTNTGTSQYIYRQYGNVVDVIDFALNGTTGVITCTLRGTNLSLTTIVSASSSFSLNKWNHIALVRSGGTNVYLYVNGVRTSITIAANAAFNESQSGFFNQPRIGATSNPNGGYYYGYVSNFRAVKGTAVYTGASLVIPTSPLTAVSGTAALTCQANRFIDAANSYSITISGTPSVQAFSPFQTNVAYTPALQGGSAYFDGTGDNLVAPNDVAFDLSTADFTISFWVYPTQTASLTRLIEYANGTALNSNYSWIVVMLAGGQVRFSNFSGTSQLNVSAGTLVANAWNYVVVTRTGASATVYVNGASTTGTVYATSNLPTGSVLTVGAGYNISNSTVGYMSNVRIVKGSVLTPSGIPTSPLTTVTGTSLLLQFTNGAIVDATGKNVLETVGTAQASTAQSKFGRSSIYFDGTATPEDKLVMPISAMQLIGQSDYTFECWVRLQNVSTLQTLITYGSNAFRIFINSTNVWFLISSTTIINSNGGFTTGSWFHVAVVRKGFSSASNTACWVNGARISTPVTNATDFNVGTTIQIGGEGTGNLFQGYMQDVRLTKFARYDPASSTITPPTSLTQDQ